MRGGERALTESRGRRLLRRNVLQRASPPRRRSALRIKTRGRKRRSLPPCRLAGCGRPPGSRPGSRYPAGVTDGPLASWEFTLCPQINDPVLNSAGRHGGLTAAFRRTPADARSQPDLITFKHFDDDVFRVQRFKSFWSILAKPHLQESTVLET